jgi:hypothetical protein
MKASISIPSVALLLILGLEGLTDAARRNKVLEARRDRRLAAEAAAATAAAAAATATAAHATARMAAHFKNQLPSSSEASEGSLIRGQTSHQHNLRLKDRTRVPENTHSQASSSIPKRVVVKLGGVPLSSSMTTHHSVSPQHRDADINPSKASAIRGPFVHPSLSNEAIGSGSSSWAASADELSHSAEDNSDNSYKPPSRRKSTTKIHATGKQKQAVGRMSTFLPKKAFRPDSSRFLYDQSKDYFDKVWKEHGLGVHMHPHALADSIKMMSAAGLDAQTAKRIANTKMKDAPSKEYLDNFNERIRQWNSAATSARRYLAEHNSSFFDLAEEEKRARTYQRASRLLEDENRHGTYRARKAKGLPRKEILYGRKKELDEERETLIDEIGRLFEKDLAAKNLDFNTMSIEEIEIEARERAHPKANPFTYPKLLLEYISRHRSDGELMRYRSERLKANTARSHQADREKRIKSGNA